MEFKILAFHYSVKKGKEGGVENPLEVHYSKVTFPGNTFW
jgi:hypothetical protein